ncbi:hypothetical protein AB0362_12960 [Rhodococcus sp. NPDC079359]|uniref:hypothetical protein n=1 Tax=Rhodococcus sp. NPDC079359 TaxID=3154961 RepID=UPI00344B12C7
MKARTYRVTLTQEVNITLDVEAESAADARTVAIDEAYVGLCHQCAREIDLDPLAWNPITDAPVEVPA